MRRLLSRLHRLDRLDALDYSAIAACLVAVIYAGWVAVDAGSGKSDKGRAAPEPTTPSASVQVAAPETSDKPPGLGPFRRTASRADTILVVGDSTGAGAGQWVDLVAQDLGVSDSVSLHQWDESSGAFPSTSVSYGDARRSIDLWNLSYHGVAPDYADHLHGVPRPDIVLVDVGHDRSPGAAARAVTSTVDGIGARWGDVPTAIVLQNPAVGNEESQQRRVVRRLTKLAAELDDPVVDVYSAFEDAADPALVTSESRPSSAGSRLWADVVDRALGVASRRQ